MTIGQKIIQLRNSRGISQEKLAELAGCHPAYINLLLHTFIFVIVSIVGAISGVSSEKTGHFVLVQPLNANVGILVFIVIVKFAALAGGGGRFLIF